MKKKNAQPRENAELSAVSKRIFTYPANTASACAEVLARLIAGEVLTAADTLDDACTMRAAAHVHYLSTRYGWPIEVETRAAGCADGRMAFIAAYRLPADCIHEARAAGAATWCATVRKARLALNQLKHSAALRLSIRRKLHEAIPISASCSAKERIASNERNHAQLHFAVLHSHQAEGPGA